MSDCCFTTNEQLSSYNIVKQVAYHDDDDDNICFLLGQHADLDFYSSSSLKKQPTGRHVALLWHMILSQPVFVLTP